MPGQRFVRIAKSPAAPNAAFAYRVTGAGAAGRWGGRCAALALCCSLPSPPAPTIPCFARPAGLEWQPEVEAPAGLAAGSVVNQAISHEVAYEQEPLAPAHG